MKKALFSIVVLAGLCAGISSCDNGAYNATPDNVSTAPNPIYDPTGGKGGGSGGSGDMTADIDGFSFHASAPSAFWADTMSIFMIYGGMNVTDANNIKVINLTPASRNPGTYDLKYKAVYLNSLQSSGSHTADSGSLTIASNSNGVIQGTFYFYAGGIKITNGKFSVKKLQ